MKTRRSPACVGWTKCLQWRFPTWIYFIESQNYGVFDDPISPNI